MLLVYMAVEIPVCRTEIPNLKRANSSNSKRNRAVRNGTFAVFTMHSKPYTYNGDKPCEIWRHREKQGRKLLGLYLSAVGEQRETQRPHLQQTEGPMSSPVLCGQIVEDFTVPRSLCSSLFGSLFWGAPSTQTTQYPTHNYSNLQLNQYRQFVNTAT